MKFILNSLITILFLNIVFIKQSVAQESTDNPMSFNIYRVYPAISFTKDEFSKFKSIIDINERYFKPEWVKSYISVEISALKNGKLLNALGENEILTQEQIQLIYSADLNTEISVNVKYMPDNNLSHNEVQVERFKFFIDPKTDAKFAGDHDDLLKFIKQKAIDKIPAGLFGLYKLSVIGFSVNETGQIVDVNFVIPTEDEVVDKLLYETVCNIGLWTPAEYTNGTKVKQEFVLAVGNMQSCNTNLINIRRGHTYDEDF